MWAEIITTILGVIVFGVMLTVWLIINKREMKIDIKPNAPLFKNFTRTDFTDGYAEGLVDRIKLCKNGCYRIEYFPTDRQEGQNVKRPSKQKVIYHKSGIRFLSNGDLSERRVQIWGIGSSPEDLPRGIKNSSLGKWAENESYLSFLNNQFGANMKETLNASAQMIKQNTALGLTSVELARLREISAEERKLLVQSLLREGQEPEKKM